MHELKRTDASQCSVARLPISSMSWRRCAMCCALQADRVAAAGGAEVLARLGDFGLSVSDFLHQIFMYLGKRGTDGSALRPAGRVWRGGRIR